MFYVIVPIIALTSDTADWVEMTIGAARFLLVTQRQSASVQEVTEMVVVDEMSAREK